LGEYQVGFVFKVEKIIGVSLLFEFVMYITKIKVVMWDTYLLLM